MQVGQEVGASEGDGKHAVARPHTLHATLVIALTLGTSTMQLYPCRISCGKGASYLGLGIVVKSGEGRTRREACSYERTDCSLPERPVVTERCLV
jgi:hypothetical protein